VRVRVRAAIRVRVRVRAGVRVGVGVRAGAGVGVGVGVGVRVGVRVEEGCLYAQVLQVGARVPCGGGGDGGGVDAGGELFAHEQRAKDLLPLELLREVDEQPAWHTAQHGLVQAVGSVGRTHDKHTPPFGGDAVPRREELIDETRVVVRGGGVGAGHQQRVDLVEQDHCGGHLLRRAEDGAHLG
jgi:hypothetical protein